MKRVKVLHQVLNPSGIGGVTAEYLALKKSELSRKYEFQSMVLLDCRSGINFHDIKFYYKQIKHVKPDIVHVRGAAVDGLNAIIAAKMAGHCKILTTVHGMYSDLVYISPIKKWIAKNIIERAIFLLSDGISCVCKNATERSYFDRYRKKMLPFVYNRMPQYDIKCKNLYREKIRSQYNLTDDIIICLFVGRMTREKGLSVFEEIFKKKMIEGVSNLVFLFVGDGDYCEQFKINCQKYSAKTIFAGMQKDVMKYYMAADFFIQPSLHENHSIALLEACAAQLPSIATDCGGNNEIVLNNFTGSIVPIGNAEALAAAIRALCDDKCRKKYISNIKSMKYSQFSNESCDRALDNVYQQILKL